MNNPVMATTPAVRAAPAANARFSSAVPRELLLTSDPFVGVC
jgi:hypothetical protein